MKSRVGGGGGALYREGLNYEGSKGFETKSGGSSNDVRGKV